jgi:hypothetical protein
MSTLVAVTVVSWRCAFGLMGGVETAAGGGGLNVAYSLVGCGGCEVVDLVLIYLLEGSSGAPDLVSVVV